jgi:hypothetical protein
MKPSTGAAVRLHRNAVRDQPESLSAFKWNACPPSPEYPPLRVPADAESTLIAPPAGACTTGGPATWQAPLRPRIRVIASVRAASP